jgi:transposase
MLSQEVCLVSIDESNFKQKEPKRFWHPRKK